MRVAVILVLLVAQVAQAGTREMPEISDPLGDAEAPLTATLGAQAALDIEAIWFTYDPLVVHWGLDATTESGPVDRFEYRMTFDFGSEQVRLLIFRQQAEQYVAGGFWVAGESNPCGHSHSINGAAQAILTVDDAEGELSLSMPDECLAGLAPTAKVSNILTNHCVFGPLGVPLRCSSPDSAAGDVVVSLREPGAGNATTAGGSSATAGSVNDSGANGDSQGNSIEDEEAGFSALPLLAVAIVFAARRRR